MIACNNPGATDYIDKRYRSDGTVTVSATGCDELGRFEPAWMDMMENNIYIRQYRLRLFSDLGAFVLNGQLVYWRARDRSIVRPVRDRRPLVVRAGYMNDRRGRHWDRKRI